MFILLHPYRAINYDERDPFMCNACGYSKYAKFEVTVEGRPCSAVDPIESEEDRKKVCVCVWTCMCVCVWTCMCVCVWTCVCVCVCVDMRVCLVVDMCVWCTLHTSEPFIKVPTGFDNIPKLFQDSKTHCQGGRVN